MKSSVFGRITLVACIVTSAASLVMAQEPPPPEPPPPYGGPSPVLFPSPLSPTRGLGMSVAAADFDGDGRIDLAVVNTSAEYPEVWILRGLGDGSFQTLRSYPTGCEPGSVLAADLSGDGHVDLVTANRAAGGVSVLLG